jgi:hypothetical protein
VCNDGIIGAGKLQVWKQWANFHGARARSCLKPSGSNHDPGLHLLIFGVNKPYHETNRVRFRFAEGEFGMAGVVKHLSSDLMI